MKDDTTRSRLTILLQKSRKAFRLYGSMGRSAFGQSVTNQSNKLGEFQALAWQRVNADLVTSLTAILNERTQKSLVSRVFLLRDQYESDFRSLEASLYDNKRTLLVSAEKEDYMKAALLASDLITMRAQFEATKAVYHELDQVITKGKLSRPQGLMKNDSSEKESIKKGDDVEQKLNGEFDQINRPDKVAVGSGLAKVIPIRRKSVS